MFHQAVAGLLVRERGHGQRVLIGIASIVLDVAQLAIVAVFQHAVNAGRCLALVRHIRVAVFAQRRHDALPGRVTELAAALEIDVRLEVLDRRPIAALRR